MAIGPQAADPGAAASVADGDADPSAEALPQRWHDPPVQQLDPVGWRLAEALTRRASPRHGQVRALLDGRARHAVAAHHQHCRRALDAIEGLAAPLALRFPAAQADIDRLRAAGDILGLRRLAAHLDNERGLAPLAELARRIDGAPAAASTADPHSASIGDAPASARELRTLSDGRPTWIRLGIDRQLKRSRDDAPGNPGPFNSHQLMVRALHEMNAVSPAYLERFIAYAETLCWLDAASFGAATPTAQPARRTGDRKRRARRDG